MNLSLVSPKYFSKNSKYFGFFSDGIENEIESTFLLRGDSRLSEQELEEIELESLRVNNILISKFIEYKKESNASFYFHQFFLNPLLIFVTQTFYYRLKQLYNFLEYYDHAEIEKIILLPINCKFHRAKNTTESLVLLNEDAFSSWINSYIFFSKLQHLNKHQLYFIEEPENITKRVNNFECIKIFSKKILNYKNEYDRELFRIKKELKVEKKIERKKPSISVEPNEDIDIIFEIFLKIAPITYFETPVSFHCKFKSFNDSPVIFNGLKIYDDVYRSYISKKYSNGITIIGVQHGGHNYGTGKFVGFLINELKFCDYFVSWGWDLNFATQTKSLSLQRPSRVFNKQECRSPNRIIWVGTHMNINPSRLDSNPQPSDFLKYRVNKLEAISFLNFEQNIYKIYYRPYFTNFEGLKDLEYFLAKIPNLSILYGENLEKKLFEFKLIIIDHPGTLLNFAIANDIPILCFWADDFFYFTDEALEIYDQFKKVNLLFNKIENLNNHLANTNNINIWWKSAEVESVKNIFKYKYCNIRNNDID